MNQQERAIKASWDDNAAAWTETVRQGRIESRARVTNAAIVSAVLRTGGSSVLDIGCGEGWLCRALAAHGIEVTGFDGSAALIAEARALGGAAFQVLGYDDFGADPARAGGPFDVGVCNFALLGEDVLPIIAGAAAVLAPTGVLIVQTLHPFAALGAAERYEDGWRSEDFSGMGAGFRAGMPWYYRKVESWIALIRAAGLELMECQETTYPDTGRPVSLLLTGRSAALGSGHASRSDESSGRGAH